MEAACFLRQRVIYFKSSRHKLGKVGIFSITQSLLICVNNLLNSVTLPYCKQLSFPSICFCSSLFFVVLSEGHTYLSCFWDACTLVTTELTRGILFSCGVYTPLARMHWKLCLVTVGGFPQKYAHQKSYMSSFFQDRYIATVLSLASSLLFLIRNMPSLNIC